MIVDQSEHFGYLPIWVGLIEQLQTVNVLKVTVSGTVLQ